MRSQGGRKGRGPRGNNHGPPRDNSRNSQNSPQTGHTTLYVSGWTQSKAADNQDPVTSLVGWLERKASPHNGPKRRVHRSNQQGKVLEIEVDAADAERFLHLDGFTFAGAVINVANDNRGNHQTQQSRNEATTTARTKGFGDNTRNAPAPLRLSGSAAADSVPISKPVFRDADGIGEKFVRAFFPLYDNNRELAIQQFYDDHSQFSFSLKMGGAKSRGRPRIDWSEYIKRSRNLTKVHKPQARAESLFKGQQAIFNEWSQLPKTNHPIFAGKQLHEWLLECTPVRNLPNALTTGQGPSVDGLEITTHGVFEDQSSNGTVTLRGFDRTFILGPGTGASGLRVISDMLVLRPYSGNYSKFYDDDSLPAPPSAPTAATFFSTPSVIQLPTPPVPPPAPILVPPTPPQNPSATSSIPAIPAAALASHPEVEPGSTVGQAAPGKTEEQVLKERMCLELSFKTKLKLAMADQALVANNWSFDAALANIEQLIKNGGLPGDAFLNV